MNRFVSNSRKETKLQMINKSYHLSWALPPYLRPAFQYELCDTGLGRADWHKLQTWKRKKKKEKKINLDAINVILLELEQ